MAENLTVKKILDVIAGPARSKAQEYMVRVDQHLETLADDAARVAFLRAQVERWQTLYSAWALRIDDGSASKDDLGCTAFDFVETITALGGKLNEFAAEQRAAIA